MRITVPRTQPSQARFTITITYKVDPVPETVTFLKDLVSTIATAAANGAFRKTLLHKTQSYATPPIPLPGGPRQTVLQIDLNAVDLRFVECLRSACEVHELSAQIEAIAIDTAPASGDTATIAHPNGIDGRDIYPPLLSPRMHIDNQFDTATCMHQIIVELDTLAQARNIDGLEEFVAPWGELLEAGAFSLPRLDPALSYSVMGPTKLFEANSIEVLIDRFDADLEGINALLNMIDTYAARTPGLRSATLY